MSLHRDHDLGPLAGIPSGEGRNFRVGGATVAVFHTRLGEIYATQPNCPHRQGPLADGLLGDATLVCPLHDSAFDLRTGDQVGGQCRLDTYPVRVSADATIVITLPVLPAES